ncbi:methyltransferase domain-containing protein [Dyella soli]|uniref:Methyltransferase domain-containing protein n=1 Tax=Dyella soli TaxID=522319 RepID=A0A4V6NA04_9GAMM|nr:methyltransferase domain-containing protein [Dyella soli]TCI11131.1 methyltransferase domain-containing protein [Dyella soli]
MNVDQLMRQIQDEVVQRRRHDDAAPSGVPDDGAVEANDHWVPATSRVVIKQAYALSDLVDLDDRDFVETAYRALLRRPADPDGLASCLSDLRNGIRNKVHILGDIRFSPEGMSRGVHVEGLLLPYKLQQWSQKRFIGRPLAWLHAFVRLPAYLRRLDRMGAVQAREVQHLGHHVNAFAAGMLRRIERQEQEIEQHKQEIEQEEKAISAILESALPERDQAIRQAGEKIDNLNSELQLVTGQSRVALARLYERLAQSSSEQESLVATAIGRLENQLAKHKGELQRLHTDSARSLLELRYVVERGTVQASRGGELPDRNQSEPSSVPNAHDALYASFEDEFRGTREDIKSRVEHYLPAVRHAVGETSAGLVVDLGCGRGEWLELLREHGIKSCGVDLNKVMLAECKASDLDVTEQDALVYLRSLSSDSVSAITSMHLVEHLPFDVLLELLDEAFRVLRIGGILILETPNPENLLMATQWFYIDPTHRNPIPPPLLSWLARARGFSDVSIERLTANRGVVEIEDVPAETAAAPQLNQLLALLRAAPDYAIVAYKR